MPRRFKSLNIKSMRDFILSGTKETERDRNFGIERDRTFLSPPSSRYATPKRYLSLSLIYPPRRDISISITQFTTVSSNSSIFSYTLVYPWDKIYLFLSLLTKNLKLPILLSIFTHKIIESLSIPFLSHNYKFINLYNIF